MSISCGHCEGTGFLNIHDDLAETLDAGGIDTIRQWMLANPDSDVSVCDCCGDGDEWYGEPGAHYTSDDPAGRVGPYANNGGWCKCH